MAGSLLDADREGLIALTTAQVQSGLAGDWAAFVDTLTTDVVRMPPDLPPIAGHERVAAWQRTFPRIVDLTNWIDDIQGDGALAYMRGHNAITLELEGQPTRLSFKWFAVYRKGANGSWKMAADMWNSNPPLTE